MVQLNHWYQSVLIFGATLLRLKNATYSDFVVTKLAVAESTDCPKRVPDLDINTADEGFIIYQAERDRVHYLNPTAVFILELCDGERSISEITELVKEAYGLPESPASLVEEVIEKMKLEGLLK
jgi:methyltransferase-like protein